MHPTLARRFIYPLQERLLKRPTFAYLSELEKTQWLSRAEIERLQMTKLKSLLRLAATHCPWHAENIQRAGIELNDRAPFLEPKEFKKLPTMTKADAIAHGNRMVWKGAPGGAFRYNTGGSSGQPLIFYYGRLRQASDAAGRMRARRWWGVEVGEPEVYLWGAPVELNKTDYMKTFRDRLVNQLVLNAFAMSPANMERYLRAIQRFQPKCLYGYASSIALLAAHAKSRQIKPRLTRLKVVCTTGEPLFPNQRELIAEVFEAPVADEFGSRDIGFTAHESPEGQMLLISESLFLEVLDASGQSVAPGEVGEAVITGLCSETQPFIRYRTGDMVRATEEACKAGRGLHVIGEVMGRKTDFITRDDGTIMHALAVIYIMRSIEGIREFKIIQHTTTSLEIQIVADEAWKAEKKDEIIKQFQNRLGNELAVEIHLLDRIPPEISGKHRYVVSHVPLPSALNFPAH